MGFGELPVPADSKQGEAEQNRGMYAAGAVGVGAPTFSVRFNEMPWAEIAAVVLVVIFIFVTLALLATSIVEWRRRRKTIPLEVTAWAAMAIGVFVRQNIDISQFAWSMAHFGLGGFTASCAISLAIFPWTMRRIAKYRPRPGLEAIAYPFSFGFFLDLARLGAITYVPRLSGIG